MGSTRIYFAQFQLYLRGVPRPLVLIHLTKAKQLAQVVTEKLEPFRLSRRGRSSPGPGASISAASSS